MYRISDEIKEFAESAIASAVGSASDAGLPQTLPGWGLRICEDRVSGEIFIDAPRAAQTLANLRENGRIAVMFAAPVTYRSIQFKGHFIEAGEPTLDDCAWVERQREAFVSSTSLVGDSLEGMRNLWMREVVRVRFTIERAYDQTPGPSAGEPL